MLILSLTSFPKRLPCIGPCLDSLLAQSHQPDRIVLWLGCDEFPCRLEDVTPQIRKYSTECGGNVEFRFTRDLRSFTKLLPALAAFPEAFIITADDDVVYDRDMVKRLYEASIIDPCSIFAHAVSDVYKRDGKWVRTTGAFGFGAISFVSPLRMVLGIGGVLYPPHCLSEQIVSNVDIFQKLTPTNDDIWFWFAAVRCGTRVKRVPYAISHIKGLPSSGIDALSAINETDGDRGNLEQLEALFTAYPEFEDELSIFCHQKRALIILCRLRRFIAYYPRQIIFCLSRGGFQFLKTEMRKHFAQ